MPGSRHDVSDVGLGIGIKRFHARGAAKENFLSLVDSTVFDRALAEWRSIHCAVVERVFGVGCLRLVGGPGGFQGGY